MILPPLVFPVLSKSISGQILKLKKFLKILKKNLKKLLQYFKMSPDILQNLKKFLEAYGTSSRLLGLH